LNIIGAELNIIGNRIIAERTDIQAIIDLLGTDQGTLESQMTILNGLVAYVESESASLEEDNSELQAQVSEYTIQIA